MQHQRNVLLVEDDSDLREAMAGIIEEEGYQVVPAGDGVEALSILRSGWIPCLILLDLMMPRMNGWQFREEQLKDPQLAQIPVVVVSATTQVQQVPIQANDFLTKPVNFEKLLGVLSQHC